MRRSGSISRYALYGEPSSKGDPEFVHIEDISARSLLYEWRIQPHTHAAMMQLVVLRTGSTTLWLDELRKEVRAPCAVLIPSGVVHGFHFEADTAGQVVTAADALVAGARELAARRQFKTLQLRPMVLDFSRNSEAFARVEATLTQMDQEFRWPQAGRAAMLEWLLRVLLMIVRRQADLQEVQTEARADRLDVMTRFRQLVEDHHRAHWDIADYARSLSVSAATLNRLCRLFTGKPALELVQERLLTAARRDLIYTDAPVEVIAYGLGFQDPAYFSRFFKRRTGLAPGQFRRAREGPAF